MPIRFLLPLVLNLFLLASCGGGGSDSSGTPPVQTPPSPPASDYLSVTGTVTAPTGVAADSLMVVSLGRDTAVDGVGAYSAEVHPDAVSLVIATQAGRPFALARIVVADSGFAADAVSIDTTSTAVSMVFVSPFIMTQDPAEAATRLALIENDVAIPALAQAIDDAFSDVDPFQNAAFLAALENALISVASQLTPVTAFPNVSEQAKGLVDTMLVRLPRRSGTQITAAAQAAATSIEIDLEFTDIEIEASGDQYFLRPTSIADLFSLNFNAVDWLVEVGEVDYSGFQYTHQLEPMLDDPYTVYPRVGPLNDPVGIDINEAQGLYQWVDFVSMGLNWLVDEIQNGASPSGISVSQTSDGLYIVRAFSSGAAGSILEDNFVQFEVPNGALNHRRARTINHLSAAMDVLGIAIDLLPVIDDTIANECVQDTLRGLYTNTSVSIELTGEVVSEVITATAITQDLIIDFSTCVIGRAGIVSATGLGWLSDVWDVIKGIGGIPLAGAQLTERYSFMFVRATPLESVLIQVGSPVVDDNEPPTVPAILTATPVSTSQLQLLWSESSDNDDVAEYVLYRDSEIIGSTDTLSLQDSGLTTSTTYCYEIEAFDFVGNSSGRSSPPVCATTLSVPDTTPPTVPQNVAANVISDTAIDLSWSSSSDDRAVSEYVVTRDGQSIGAVSGTTISDTGLAAGTQYCYTVAAYDAAGNFSDPSSPPICATTAVTPDTTAPTVPTGVIATAISDTEINVAWNESSDDMDVTGYRVFRDTAPVDTTTTLNYSDSLLGASTTYCYTISAYDLAGNESLPSTIPVCATTLATSDTMPPSVPTGLNVIVVSSGRIDLSWDAATDNVGVTDYNIYRDSVLHDTVTELSYTDLGLSGSTEYCFAVSALDAAGNESVQSAAQCGTTSSPSAPTVTKIVDSDSVLPNNGSLSCLGVPPIDGDAGRIVFHANGNTGQALYVVENGTIRQIATGDTVAPGPLGPFGIFSDSAVDSARTFFTSGGGLYVEEVGAISLVADITTISPRGAETFGGFYSVDADNGLVAFSAGSSPSSPFEVGVYRFDSAGISVIADTETDDPGNSGNFTVEVTTGFRDISVGGGVIAFGTSVQVGIDITYAGVYAHDGANLQVAADTNTAFPNGRDSFFSGPKSIDDNGRILFDAFDGDVSHPIYGWQASTIDLMVDVPMVISGTSTVLNTWKGWSVADTNRVVTQNFWEDQGDLIIGMYLHENGGITKIIDTNDIIDGKETLDLFPEVLDQGILTFVAWFVDDSCGIYSVELDGM